MRSAVYFPLIHPDEQLMKRALLSWDFVEVPRISEAKCQHLEHSSAFNEAHELVCRPIFVDDDLKRGIHSVLQQTDCVPTFFRYDPILDDALGKNRAFPHEFLLPASAELLIKLQMAKNQQGIVKVGLKSLFLLAALLGDVAAGQTKQRLTDDLNCYRGLCELLAGTVSLDPDSNSDVLLSLALKTVDLSPVPLESLVQFRKREMAERHGSDLRQLRHKFVDHLSQWAQKLSQANLTTRDRTEVTRLYEQALQQDMHDLRSELKTKQIQLVLSKEILTTALSSAAVLASLPIQGDATAMAASVTGAVGAIAGVYAARSKFFESRKEILRRHAMAYIYELSHT